MSENTFGNPLALNVSRERRLQGCRGKKLGFSSICCAGSSQAGSIRKVLGSGLSSLLTGQ